MLGILYGRINLPNRSFFTRVSCAFQILASGCALWVYGCGGLVIVAVSYWLAMAMRLLCMYFERFKTNI